MATTAKVPINPATMPQTRKRVADGRPPLLKTGVQTNRAARWLAATMSAAAPTVPAICVNPCGACHMKNITGAATERFLKSCALIKFAEPRYWNQLSDTLLDA